MCVWRGGVFGGGCGCVRVCVEVMWIFSFFNLSHARKRCELNISTSVSIGCPNTCVVWHCTRGKAPKLYIYLPPPSQWRRFVQQRGRDEPEENEGIVLLKAALSTLAACPHNTMSRRRQRRRGLPAKIRSTELWHKVRSCTLFFSDLPDNVFCVGNPVVCYLLSCLMVVLSNNRSDHDKLNWGGARESL